MSASEQLVQLAAEVKDLEERDAQSQTQLNDAWAQLDQVKSQLEDAAKNIRFAELASEADQKVIADLQAKLRDLQAQLVDLQARFDALEPAPSPPPIPAPGESPIVRPDFELKLNPADPASLAAWPKQATHDGVDSMAIVTGVPGVGAYVEVTCGAHAPNSGGSTYMRKRPQFPEQFDLAFRKGFLMEADIELLMDPGHYWSGLRTDNYQGTMKTSKAKVGTLSGSELRYGFTFENDGRISFAADHQTKGKIPFWTSAKPLAKGRHKLKFEVQMSKGGDGAWAVEVDGERVERRGIQTVPPTVPDAEAVVTRAVTCVDGANKWTDRPIEMRVFWARFAGER